jgi:hypothetical protein
MLCVPGQQRAPSSIPVSRTTVCAGLAAAAVALAAILDDSKHVAVQPAAARQLVTILGTLTKRMQRRGKLAVVKSMTSNGNG